VVNTRNLRCAGTRPLACPVGSPCRLACFSDHLLRFASILPHRKGDLRHRVGRDQVRRNARKRIGSGQLVLFVKSDLLFRLVGLQVHVFCFFSSATISRFVPNLRPSRRVNPAPTLDESLNYCSFPVVHVGPTPTFKQYADCRRRRFLGRSTYSGCPLLAFFADGGGTQFVRDQDLHVSNATASLLVPTGLVSLCIVDIET